MMIEVGMDDDGLRRVSQVDTDMDPEIWGNQKKRMGLGELN